MLTAELRLPAVVFVSLALFWLAGCGSNGTHVCPLSSASSCCGPGNSACPIGPQFLFAAGYNGQLSGFPINPGTGGLGTPFSTPGPANSFGMAAFNGFLYASNPVLSGVGSINGWSIDSMTGVLTALPGSPFGLGPLSLPGGLAMNSSAQVLYAADAGKVDAFKIDSMGAISPIPGSPFPAGSYLFLTIDPVNKFLFTSDNTPPGNVWAFTIDSTGALTDVPGSPFPTIPNHVGSTSPGEVVVDSTSSYVYVALLATNQIAAFSISPATGALTPVPGSPFNTGNGPFGLATAGKFLYVSNSLDGKIAGYSIDPPTGILTAVANSPFLIAGLAMTTDPNGQFLYTSSSSGILAFSIDPNTGNLTQIGSPPPSTGATALTFVQ